MNSRPPVHAMVLAAGLGTRLRPLTEEIPKPLVPILGQPLLGSILETLHEQGAAKLVVNAHHRADEISSYINGLRFKVHVLHEERILGTAGGVAHARPLLRGGNVIVVNGDIVGPIPVAILADVAFGGLTLAVTHPRSGEGTVGVGSRGEVVRLRGERFGEEARGLDYMGLAVLGPDCLEHLPDEGCLMGDFSLPMLRKGGEVQTVLVEEPFEDIGTPEAYLEAHLTRLENRCVVAPSARVEETVRVARSFIGAGVEVAGEGALSESVVLGDVQVRGVLSRVIVTPKGRVMQVGETLGSDDV